MTKWMKEDRLDDAQVAKDSGGAVFTKEFSKKLVWCNLE